MTMQVNGTSVRVLIAAVSLLGIAAGAEATPIISATSAVINSGGPGFGSINDTFNHAGLLTNYVSGVTDFDIYLATNPQHSSQFAGFEWFSNQGSSTASVTYNLGSVNTISAVALWNEEASGIGLLNLFYSVNGITFTPLLSGLLPTDHPPFPAPYGADVYSFAAVNAQYIRFDASNCPQQPPDFNACAIGEVAFRQGEQVAAAVPEPATLTLFGLGAVGSWVARRRRARA